MHTPAFSDVSGGGHGHAGRCRVGSALRNGDTGDRAYIVCGARAGGYVAAVFAEPVSRVARDRHLVSHVCDACVCVRAHTRVQKNVQCCNIAACGKAMREVALIVRARSQMRSFTSLDLTHTLTHTERELVDAATATAEAYAKASRRRHMPSNSTQEQTSRINTAVLRRREGWALLERNTLWRRRRIP